MDYLESLGMEIDANGQPRPHGGLADPSFGESFAQVMPVVDPQVGFNLIAYTTIQPDNLQMGSAGIMTEKVSPFGDLQQSLDVPYLTPAIPGNSDDLRLQYFARGFDPMISGTQEAIAPSAFVPSGPLADSVQGAIHTLTQTGLAALGLGPAPGVAAPGTARPIPWGMLLLLGGGVYFLSKRRHRG